MVRTWLPVLRGVALIMAMMSGCGVVLAEPSKASADYIMRGCRTAVLPITFSNTVESKEDASRTALCFGIINALSYVGHDFGACLPVDTTSRQAVSVVVQYIDGHPEKIHENFNSLAVEAMREAWPCLDLTWRNLIDPHFPIAAK